MGVVLGPFRRMLMLYKPFNSNDLENTLFASVPQGTAVA